MVRVCVTCVVTGGADPEMREAVHTLVHGPVVRSPGVWTSFRRQDQPQFIVVRGRGTHMVQGAVTFTIKFLVHAVSRCATCSRTRALPGAANVSKIPTPSFIARELTVFLRCPTPVLIAPRRNEIFAHEVERASAARPAVVLHPGCRAVATFRARVVCRLSMQCWCARDVARRSRHLVLSRCATRDSAVSSVTRASQCGKATDRIGLRTAADALP